MENFRAGKIHVPLTDHSVSSKAGTITNYDVICT